MKKFLAIGALLVASTNAWALSYTIGSGSSVSLNTADPGLVLSSSLSSGLSGKTFNLNDGQSTTFNFFTIWTSETSVNADDTVAKLITATLDFSTPDINAVVTGSTVGISGIIQMGVLTWTSPAIISIADRVFSVTLSNAVFNSGLFGLDEGVCDGAQVTATVTQRSSRVPDGGMTLSLFGASLLGLIAFRRKFA